MFLLYLKQGYQNLVMFISKFFCNFWVILADEFVVAEPSSSSLLPDDFCFCIVISFYISSKPFYCYEPNEETRAIFYFGVIKIGLNTNLLPLCTFGLETWLVYFSGVVWRLPVCICCLCCCWNFKNGKALNICLSLSYWSLFKIKSPDFIGDWSNYLIDCVVVGALAELCFVGVLLMKLLTWQVGCSGVKCLAF